MFLRISHVFLGYFKDFMGNVVNIMGNSLFLKKYQSSNGKFIRIYTNKQVFYGKLCYYVKNQAFSGKYHRI